MADKFRVTPDPGPVPPVTSRQPSPLAMTEAADYLWPHYTDDKMPRAAFATRSEECRRLALRFDAARRAAFDLSDDDLERIVRTYFLRNKVYGGYNDETKEAEWHRNRNLEMNYAKQLLKSLRALASPQSTETTE